MLVVPLQKLIFKAFPNPSSRYISLSGLTDAKFNVQGKELLQGSLIKNNKIDINRLDGGVYFLTIDHLETMTFIKK